MNTTFNIFQFISLEISSNMYLNGALIIFIISFLIQLVYYLKMFSRVAFVKKKKNKDAPPISLVICAKNEEQNLKEFLPLVLEQSYDKFEVIVVNDASTDGTEIVLANIKLKYPELYITNMPENDSYPGKKLALTCGIKAAKYENILLTDADCFPKSKHWISSMASRFSDNDQIILGYCGYKKRKGILNTLICYDAFFIGLQYLSFAAAKTPYMGVGRNLAYKKDLFFKNKGFARYRFLASGDDDLFIKEVANNKNTAVAIEPDSFMVSIPPDSFTQWRRMKKRHFTTFKYYSSTIKILLTLEPLSRLLFYALFTILVIYYQEFIYSIVTVFSIRLFVQILILRKSLNKLNEKGLFPYFVLLDIFIPLVLFYINMFYVHSRDNYKWR